MPKRTYKQRNQVFNAKKAVKDHVTILLGASMDGFELKPLVICKSARPRALIGCDLYALPVHYYDQKHAWMSTKIIEHWFFIHLKDEIKAHYGDQKVIMTLNRYCEKMMDHVMGHPDNYDPIAEFSRTYTIKDCIYDIAEAWDSVGKSLINKCFEN